MNGRSHVVGRHPSPSGRAPGDLRSLSGRGQGFAHPVHMMRGPSAYIMRRTQHCVRHHPTAAERRAGTGGGRATGHPAAPTRGEGCRLHTWPGGEDRRPKIVHVRCYYTVLSFLDITNPRNRHVPYAFMASS